MRLAAGPAGGAIALPKPPSRYNGKGDGGKGKERVGKREWRKGREGKVVKDYGGVGRRWRDRREREGRESGGRARPGYLSSLQFLVTPLRHIQWRVYGQLQYTTITSLYK